MDRVIYISLAFPEIKPLPDFADFTKILTGSHAYRDHVSLGFIAPTATKHESVAGIFGGVEPTGGQFSLELATELPEFLPDVDGLSDSTLEVSDKDGLERRLCLSNRMSRYHWAEKDGTWHTLLPRDEPAHGQADIEHPRGVRNPAVEEIVRTMASMTFAITGSSAEEAFETSIRKCIDAFFFCTNRIQVAMRRVMEGFRPSMSPLTWDTVGRLYVLMSNDQGHSESTMLMVKGTRALMRPAALEGDRASRMRLIARGTEDIHDIELLLDQADASLNNGWYEFGFLQAVIAAEICTARVIRAKCESRRISKTKLDEQRDNMTYSWMLNVGLNLVLEVGNRPSDHSVSAMNAARRRRNDLMHSGIFTGTREEIRQLLSDTRGFVSSLTAHMK